MSFPIHDPSRPPTARPPSVRPPSALVPTPAPASAPPMQTGQSQLEAMLDSYVSPLTRMRPDNVAQFIANNFGPSGTPGTQAFQQYLMRRLTNWQPFLRFVATHQMQDVTEVPKLLEVVKILSARGALDVSFVTQSVMEAYDAYRRQHIVYANRLYGFGLLLQARGLMMQVEFPTPPPEEPGAIQRFLLVPARPQT
ncbi:hypothetical protein F4809DRAFT_130484 [Biscogniauxia mediterranea]|nr:hypothetical protein F4809DRAFT_130484 [Biscogniauxia mediterranea]